MRNEFASYYRPTDEEFKSHWQDSFFAFDASALLNLYSYSENTRTKLLRLLSELKSRAWLPYQAAKEYHEGRAGVIARCCTEYDKLKEGLRVAMKPLTGDKTHPFVSNDLLDDLIQLFRRAEAELDHGRDIQGTLRADDPIRDGLDEVFAGKVGSQFAAEDLSKIYSEGKTRYEKRIPPGYKDDKKEEPDKFGDLVIWKELIRFGKSASTPLIFVTDDAKEDWWWMEKEMILGPRPELRQEFKKETGQECYIYSFDNFIDQAQDIFTNITDETVKEVKEIADVRRKAQLEFEKALTYINPYESRQYRPRSSVKLDFADLPLEVLEGLLGRSVDGRANLYEGLLGRSVDGRANLYADPAAVQGYGTIVPSPAVMEAVRRDRLESEARVAELIAKYSKQQEATDSAQPTDPSEGEPHN